MRHNDIPAMSDDQLRDAVAADLAYRRKYGDSAPGTSRAIALRRELHARGLRLCSTEGHAVYCGCEIPTTP